MVFFYVKGVYEMAAEVVFIYKQYFIDNPCLEKLLDPGNTTKQSQRSYVCLKLFHEGNTILVPFRRNIEPLRKFGVIGHSLPKRDDPNAGLDYRQILVINNDAYIEVPLRSKLPRAQEQLLNQDIVKIEQEVSAYLEGYISAAIKNRATDKAKYRESSLLNFNEEFNIEEKRKEKSITKMKK